MSPSGSPREGVRVLFVGRSAAHFSYYESIIAALLARGAHVELLLDQQWSAPRKLEDVGASQPGLSVSWLTRRADAWRGMLFTARELRAYRSYLVRQETTSFYIERWRSYLPHAWRDFAATSFGDALLRTPLAAWALSALEAIAPCDGDIVRDLRARRPDVLIASPANMRFSEETDYLKAARQLGIPCAVSVLSWDNLSTKGLIHIQPDRVFVWNDYQEDDAIEIHKLPRDVLRTAGAPFFDKWFSSGADLPTRAEFCARHGFDPARPVLVYLGSSRNIARDETWLVESIKATLQASSYAAMRGVQIMVRPHPANAGIYARLIEQGYCVSPADGALPETTQDFDDMRACFAHAVATVGINTSGMIDSVLADVPTCAVRVPQYADTQERSRHFRHLEAADALYVEADVDAFVRRLAAIIGGDDSKAVRRRDFARRFARPCGLERPAGDVIAEGVLAIARARQTGTPRLMASPAGTT